MFFRVSRKFLLHCCNGIESVSRSDRRIVSVMLGVVLVACVLAAMEIKSRGSFIVDSVSLASARAEYRNAPRVVTPLQDTPFVMPEIPDPVIPERECRITDFGATPGGEASNTESFRSAIAACSKQGGGRVVVPSGVWKTGAIHLKSNINLVLEKGSRVVFSDDVREYLPAVFSRFEGIELYNYSSFIYARGVHDIAITGAGELDGNAGMWHDWNAVQEPSLAKLEKLADQGVSVGQRNFATPEDSLQPSLIQCIECRNILIDGIKILASPSWTIHPVYSENVQVRRVEVYTNARNTDGIAIDSSRNVIVQDSLFRTGDDAIVIKSGKDRDGLRVNKPSENIVIHDVTIEDGHGGIAFGSEMSGGIRNVYVYNANIIRSDFGIRMKTMRGRGGVVEDIFIENVSIRKAVFDAIQMDMTYGTPLRKDDTTSSPVFRNISISNLSVGWAKSPYTLIGLPESPISGLSFENIRVNAIRDGVASDVIGEPYANIIVKKLSGSDPKKGKGE